MSTIYDYSVFTPKGEEVSLSKFKGKVMLIFNSATGCGFTPQYEQIEEMYKKYHDKGLELIDVPCNQFGAQAPGTDEVLHTSLQHNLRAIQKIRRKWPQRVKALHVLKESERFRRIPQRP